MISWTKLAYDIARTNFSSLTHPYRYFLVVTKSCQSKCQHCKIWKEEIKNELTLDEIKLIAKKSSHLKWLNISGGEPTDRHDLPEIIKAFKDSCPHLLLVNFTTNGLEPNKISGMVKKISQLKLAKVVINVSIDGPPEINDSLRGVQGNHELACQTFKLLQDIPGVESKISMTLYHKNYLKIDETIASVQTQIPGFSAKDMHLNVPHRSPHFYGNEEMNIIPEASLHEEIQKFRKKFNLGISSLALVESIYHKYVKTYLETAKTPLPCSALQSSVYISEKGMVYPCTIWDNPIGDLRKNDYDVIKIIQDQSAQEAKRMIKASKCPQCWTPCEAYPTIMANLSKVI